MNIFSVIILSLTICIDSFLLCFLLKVPKKIHFITIPLLFTLSQIIFLSLGYFFGSSLELSFQKHAKYIIFIIFSFMSLKMITDTLINKGKEKTCLCTLKSVLLQVLLTSFDSLFLGIPLAFKFSSCFLLLVITGIATFTLCLIGLLLRNKIKNNHDDTIGILGAIVLFIFAIKSLL